MGNSQSSTSNQPQTIPTVEAVVERTKHLAQANLHALDPTSVPYCINCHKTSITPFQRQARRVKAEKLRDELSTFAPSDVPFSEKTFKLHAARQPEVWVSATKNSDHTVSYWVLHPVLTAHLSAAILQLMNIPVTRENMALVPQRAPNLFHAAKERLKETTVRCEQIDPLFMDRLVKSLYMAGYVAKSNVTNRVQD